MAQFKLPEQLEAFRPQLEATARVCTRIQLSKMQEDAPFASKVGGLPYWPKWALYPMSPDWKPLFFLAQINLSETPPLEGWPQKGMLQFFISSDRLLGMDLETPSGPPRYKVMYHETLADQSELTTDFSFLPTFKHMPIDTKAAYAMSFSLEKELAAVNDVAFDEQLGGDFFEKLNDGDNAIRNAYKKLYPAKGHKMGGYAFFAQDDPRTQGELLLLQLDTDPRAGIEWGDMGAGHFFLAADKLAQRDFASASFHWDCY
jgi:uncharacterized protein YwqG